MELINKNLSENNIESVIVDKKYNENRVVKLMAFEAVYDKARCGDANAAYLLGLWHFYDAIKNSDPDEGIKWIRLASDLGKLEARSFLERNVPKSVSERLMPSSATHHIPVPVSLQKRKLISMSSSTEAITNPQKPDVFEFANSQPDLSHLGRKLYAIGVTKGEECAMAAIDAVNTEDEFIEVFDLALRIAGEREYTTCGVDVGMSDEIDGADPFFD